MKEYHEEHAPHRGVAPGEVGEEDEGEIREEEQEVGPLDEAEAEEVGGAEVDGVAAKEEPKGHDEDKLVHPGEDVEDCVELVLLRRLLVGALVVEPTVAPPALVVEGRLDEGADEEVRLVPALAARLVSGRWGDAIELVDKSIWQGWGGWAGRN